VSAAPINLAQKLASFDDAWNPRIIAACNGNEVRVAKLRGPFVWHAHEDADELFLVVEGAMRIGIRDRASDPSSERSELVRAGELIVIPAGVEHRPASEPEGSTCAVLLINRAGEVNTGTATGSEGAAGFTRESLERLD